ncbi:aminoglycoside phosphotransferase family protein [Microbacterium sp. TNHR37B]|uniref:aminoglycoside phosphotransferase family protein n=1 Tax=Microbacterium sp. TNHR37B TaxID=1775956 RepID=UPI0007B2F5EE|nr:phosphotransferase [Microbacterium sp. TNHR37B]KZE89871.1 hypothetical protein AVP41_02673 [Microbacterium sp. TNHR37B]
MTEEHALTGGNSTAVVRVGETVRREAGPWTPAVHTLLRTLRAVGIDAVPEPIGFDDRGREVLSFLPGEVGAYPLPGWLWDPRILDDAGALLRRVHEASVPLVGQDLSWRSRAEPAEVICHNDAAPYNMTFSGGRLTGLFDFDMAGPGPRLRDLSYLAYRLAPLAEDAGAVFSTEQRLTRIDRLVSAYGMVFARSEVLAAVADRLRELAEYTDGRHRETGNPEFADHAAMYRRDARRAERLSGEATGAARPEESRAGDEA